MNLCQKLTITYQIFIESFCDETCFHSRDFSNKIFVYATLQSDLRTLSTQIISTFKLHIIGKNCDLVYFTLKFRLEIEFFSFSFLVLTEVRIWFSSMICSCDFPIEIKNAISSRRWKMNISRKKKICRWKKNWSTTAQS